jgi:predicted RecA/RadA family phage recombinase
VYAQPGHNNYSLNIRFLIQSKGDNKMPAVYLRYEDGVLTVPYTPSGADVATGDVVITNNQVGICVRPIADGELGALNIRGGVYECTGDAAIAAGKRVYWDATNDKVTETVGTNKIFGTTVTACAADNGTCDVEHNPGVDLIV